MQIVRMINLSLCVVWIPFVRAVQPMPNAFLYSLEIKKYVILIQADAFNARLIMNVTIQILSVIKTLLIKHVQLAQQMLNAQQKIHWLLFVILMLVDVMNV